MKELFLCGHTGSDNRGCEAIVRSTVGVFSKAGLKDKPVLATFAPEQDKARGLNEKTELLSYGAYSSKVQRIFYAGIRKAFKRKCAGQNKIQGKLWRRLKNGGLALNIGGDTYCYGTPTVSMALNEFNQKNGVPSVLWGCTVEADRLGKDIIGDLKGYSLIVARERMTINALKKADVDESHIIYCCDPAFTLEPSETKLPSGFKEGKTVGVNVSNLVLGPKFKEALDFLVEKIMENTDFNICFIPHVYNAKEKTGDIETHKIFLESYREYSDRISAVSEDLSCTEIKYIISKCRFFIGARTHSMVAAYSSYVPALALGYSMKSVGIASDIFGKAEGYVLHFDDIKEKSDIFSAFENIVNNEENIKAHYRKVMPEYVKTVEDTAKILFERYLK